MIGKTLGPYEVVAKLGEGGMGEVYRAHDTSLNRDVALKVLPDAVAGDPDRLARFQREAEALAALNHPNIAAIYGVVPPSGNEEVRPPRQALVMELVDGDDLSAHIARGPLALTDALPIARQIAEALEAAHERGIVHRDLKPANIKVKDDGTVKVLDFGLAKAIEQPGDQSGEMANSPTLTARATELGVILGTAAYMAPEQAKGKSVDKRADIWAFGVVLCEMLTGQRAFAGEDVSETLASVLAREPELAALPSDLPRPVRRLLTRCLEKDPKRRLRDIAEGMLQLDEGLAEGESPVAEAVVAPPVGSSSSLGRTLGALALGGAIVGAAVWMLKPAPAEPAQGPLRFALEVPGGAPVHQSVSGPDVVLSPDGSMVVFRFDGALYLRRLDAFEAVLLRGTEGGLYPFFSPDGEWVGFQTQSDRALRRVPILGGPPETVAVLDAFILGASWGPDGTIVFAETSGSDLWRVAEVGGDPVSVLAGGGSDQGRYAWPEVLPDGRAVLFTRMASRVGAVAGSLAVLDLDSGDVTDLGIGGSNPRYAPSGHVVYIVDAALRAVPFDVERLQVTGVPAPMVEGVSTKATAAGNFAIAANGTLAYVTGSALGAVFDLVMVDADGVEEVLSPEQDGYTHPRVSPGGDHLAVERPTAGGRDIWIWDLRRGGWRQLTFADGNDTHPVWTLDGSRVVFASERDPAGLYWKNADGTGQVELLVAGSNLRPYGWSADGDTMVVQNGGGVGIVSMTDRTVEPLIEESFSTEYPRVSPDGQLLAYVANTQAFGESIVVRPFPGVDQQLQASTEQGDDPVWSADGRTLYYMNALDQITRVVITKDPTLGAGLPELVLEQAYFSNGGVQFDVLPDGRFVVLKRSGDDDEPSDAGQLRLVLNFFEELKIRAPGR